MTSPGAGVMRCGSCGAGNRETARFCSSCGTSLAPVCAACGTELTAGARFCDSCGTPVGGTAASIEADAAPAPTGHVRKTVTVLFADLQGSTALQEPMDPEAAHVVIQRYNAMLRQVLDTQRGRIVKFTGDGVMAVFGVPETEEDDADRALAAGLALHAAFEALKGEIARAHGATVDLRVGVNTGEVVVSPDDADVYGDAVNVAARLEHAATPGTVLVGEETWRLTRGRATFEAPRDLHVAGKTETVRARTLRSLNVDALETRTELVGREPELALLEAQLDAAIEAAAPRLATVLGSPGVGKSRLASELEQRVAQRATVLVARCAREGGAPLAALTDLLHATADATATEPDASRLRATVDAILETGAGATPEESLWAVRRVVETTARSGPVLLVVDDLQWGAPMLLDLVEHLAEWTRGALLVLVLARPELRELRGGLTDGSRHTTVALEGLDRDGTARLATELLGGVDLPAGLLDRLPASTGGNPLFLRELLRMLVDDDVLRLRDDGAWELGVAPDAIDVPPTIQSLLAARLDRLTGDEQIVLERAAVWGTEFPLGALTELVPSDVRARVPSVIEQLRRKELLESGGTYWIDEPVHRFHHVLIRDAAYRRLLRDARADLHERLAAWVETKSSTTETEYDELVGHHLEQAYRQRVELGAPDDRTIAVGRNAAERLGRAAHRALERDDTTAGPLAARALACLPADDAQRADLLVVLCDARLTAADALAARDAVAELQQIAAPSPRLRAWAACFAAQLATLTEPGRLREIEREAAAVAEELAALGDARGAAKGHAVHASALARLGRFGEVEQVLDRALTCAREAGDRRLATVALAAAPVAAVWGPSPVPRAGGRCLDVVRLLRITAGSPVVEATSLRCQAVLESFRGRTDAARRLIAQARSTLEELGLVHGLLEAELFAGIVELGAGDLDEAAVCLRRAHEGLRELGADADSARAGALLALVALLQDDLPTAESLAREAEALAGDDLQAGISWRRVMAEVLARRGEHREALALAERAVAIAAGTDALVNHADACTALAAVRHAAGDHAGAAQAAREAVELYERKAASALAEVARAAVDAPVARPAPVTELRNRCTDALRRWAELFASGDDASMLEVISDDFTLDQRRPLLLDRQNQPQAARNMQVMRSQGVRHVDFDVVAIRGDALALVRADASADGASFAAEPNFCVIAANDNGLIESFTAFSLEDFDSAIAELERRFLEGEGASHADVWSLVVASQVVANAGDWDAGRDVFTVDTVTVDHTQSGWADHDSLSALLGASSKLMDAVPATRLVITDVIEIIDAAALSRMRISSDAVGGAMTDVLLLVAVQDRRITRTEMFAVEHLDDARAALQHLRSTDQLTNRAVETMLRVSGHFQARDHAGLADAVAAGFELDDRFTLTTVGSEHDKTDADRLNRALIDEGVAAWELSVLAVRGHRLALMTSDLVGFEDADHFHTPVLAVIEIDADDRLAAYVAFPRDDLQSAVAELERRYLDGEAAPYATVWQPIAEIGRALHAKDWDAVRATMSDRARFVGPNAGWDDADAFVAGIRTMSEVHTEGHSIGRCVHVLDEHGAVITLRIAMDPQKETYFDTYARFIVGSHGIEVLQTFEHLDDALSEFQRTSYAHDLTNEAIDVLERWNVAFAARDFEATRELVSDDFLFDDRRPVIGTVDQIDAAESHVREAAAQGLERLTITPVAVRGARLALVATTVDEGAHSAGTVSDSLAVIDVRDGRLRSWTGFAIEAVDDAVAELERQYLDGEGAPYRASWEPITRLARALSTRDFDGLADGLAPDLRGRGMAADWDGFVSRQQWMDRLRELFSVFSDPRFIARRVVAIDSSTAVFETAITSGDDEDAAEFRSLNVMHVRDDTIDRHEAFRPEQLTEAMAAFDRLSSSNELTNDAIEVFRSYAGAFEARDWDVAFSFARGDFVYDDRRSVVASQDRGASAALHSQVLAEQGVRAIVTVPLATRGRRLALLRTSWKGSEQAALFADEALSVIEIDDTGLLETCVVFEIDRFDEAVAELDARYIAGEAAPYAPMLRLIAETARALNDRDWAALRACLAPTFRAIGPSVNGGLDNSENPDEYIVRMQQLTESFDARIVASEVHAICETGIVATARIANEANAFELDQIALFHVGPRGVELQRAYPVDALDDALAEFERLTHHEQLTNAAVAAFEESMCAFESRDWDRMAAQYDAGYSTHDRRATIGWDDDPEQSLSNLRMLAERGAARMAMSPIALRGERLALIQLNIEGPDDAALDNPTLAVLEVGMDNRFTAVVTFDVSAMNDALAELDARFISGEAAPYADVFSVLIEAGRAVNARDWTALRACLADDFTAKGPAAGWDDSESPDAYVSRLQELTDTVGTLVVARQIHILTDKGVVNSTRTSGGEGDDAFHLDLYTVAHVEDGKIRRQWSFSAESLDDALAQFERLTRDESVSNAAVESFREWVRAWEARDWDRIDHLCPPGYTTRHHTSIVTHDEDREQALANVRIMAEQGGTRISIRPIAVRGQRLALLELGLIGGEGVDHFHVPLLSVIELQADHRIQSATNFDVGDLAAAQAYLNERYLAGEGQPFAATLGPSIAVGDALNRKDWARVRACLSPRFVSHGFNAGWDDTASADEWVMRLQELTHQFAGAMTSPTVDVVDGAALSATRMVSEDGSFTLDMFVLMRVGPDGIDELWSFTDDRYDKARATFERLRATQTGPTNRASQKFEEIARAFAAEDIAAVAPLTAPNHEFHDRRLGVRQVVTDASAQTAWLHAVAEQGAGAFVSTAVAVRGERLALLDTYIPAAGFRTQEGYTLVELDDSGRLLRTITFDRAALDEAIAELDRRFIAGEGAPYADWLDHLLVRGNAAMNAHDWDALRAVYDPDVEVVGHADGGWADASGFDAFLAIVEALVDAMPGARVVTTSIPRYSAEAAVCVMSVLADETAGEFEYDTVLLHHRGPKGIRRLEAFSIEQLDEAVVTFDALASRRHTNACVEAYERFVDRFMALDWDAVADSWAEDCRVVDARSVLRHEIVGRAANVEALRATAAQGADHLTCEVIATRGDRLALLKAGPASTVDPALFASVSLVVTEIDADGRSTYGCIRELADLQQAFRDLDERYLASAPAHGDVYDVILRWLVAFNAHDWEAMRALNDPALTYTDHRPAGFGTGSESAFADMGEAVLAVTPDAHMHVVEVVALDAQGALLRTCLFQNTGDGSGFDVPAIHVVGVRSGRLVSDDIFAADQLEAARKRFDEIDRHDVLTNAATRAANRMGDALLNNDVETTRAIITEDLVFDDRRSGMRHLATEAEREVWFATAVEQRLERVEATTLATRGDRLALLRSHVVADGLETAAALQLVELASGGRIGSVVLFDRDRSDDLDAAFAELDRRYVTGEGAPFRTVFDAICRWHDSFNRRDWESFVAAYSTDIEFHDHRPASYGRLDADDVMALSREVLNDSPDCRLRISAVERIAPHVALIVMDFVSEADGHSAPSWTVVEVRRDRVVAVESFLPEDTHAALRCFQSRVEAAPE